MIEPGHRRVRVRGLQSHHRRLETAEPGRRLAVNLTGVSHHEVDRGHALVRPGQWHLTAVLDASLRVLASVDHPVSDRGAFAAYVGSGDFPVRLRVLGTATGTSNRASRNGAPVAAAGGSPLPLLPGDRYVLRELGRGETDRGRSRCSTSSRCCRPPGRSHPVGRAGGRGARAGSTSTSWND